MRLVADLRPGNMHLASMSGAGLVRRLPSRESRQWLTSAGSRFGFAVKAGVDAQWREAQDDQYLRDFYHYLQVPD